MDSILTTIKKLLGLAEDDISFDTDIIIGINTAFSTLTQIGVGRTSGFSIQDKSETRTDFLLDAPDLESVKSYVHLKAKLLFDPPANSAMIDSMNNILDELTFRLYVQAGMTEA